MPATPLTAHATWEGEPYTLVLADTTYSIEIKQAAHQVTLQVEGADDVRFRHTDGDMTAADSWSRCYAGMGTLIQIVPGVNNAGTIYLATGGTSVVVRVIPEPTRGV